MPDWQFQTRPLDGSIESRDRLLCSVHEGQERVGYGRVLEAWQTDAAFVHDFNAALSAAPHAAFRWETPPVTAATVDRPFEFVLLRCDNLERAVDRQAFAEQFAAAGASVTTFPNLSGDAELVVPVPQQDDDAYGHLAAFIRAAPREQVTELWRQVGVAVQRRLGPEPIWLSTAGMGVAWLHIRLDRRPKYYAHRPYARPPA